MKARSKGLLDRAVAATVAAIEIYNKPDFLYREEAAIGRLLPVMNVGSGAFRVGLVIPCGQGA
ncbi:hypothetical protein D3C85_1808640 [compost metagenome]